MTAKSVMRPQGMRPGTDACLYLPPIPPVTPLENEPKNKPTFIKRFYNTRILNSRRQRVIKIFSVTE